MYSPLRKIASSLRELLVMQTTLPRASAQKQVPSSKIVEKLDLELEFSGASFPAKTRQTHPHILFAPMHYEPKYAYPLLVWLHGAGGDERQIMRIMPIISMQNYVAVAPRGLPIEQSAGSHTFNLSVSSILHRPKEQYDWILIENNITPIEQRIFDCITVAQERCNIASHRVFIAGFGTGGTAALRLAMLYPEHFAGAASFGGELPLGNRIFPNWQMTRPLSVLLGVEGSAPDHACRMMELLYTAGVSSHVQEYPDTKSLTPEMLQDLNRWMMQIVCQCGATHTEPVA